LGGQKDDKRMMCSITHNLKLKSSKDLLQVILHFL
jgi:hypothetical protein